jgi:Mg2+ and Co2+ transporter CorA
VESFDALADDIAEIERRVADVIFDTVRAQLRSDDADAAKELERELSKVRRSLQKAEHVLRRSAGEDQDD